VAARNRIDLETEPRSIIGTRVFDAPRKLVFGRVDRPDAFGAMVGAGRLQMPLTKAFFSSRFGMVADRFGVGWMIIVAPSATA
jgi:uncharacterized glyoxalase superfamily protein PhnB